MCAPARAPMLEQRVAHVIAVADVGDFQAAQIAEAFFEREEIGERLAGMITIGKRVDHRNARVGGQLVERFLLEYARDDAVHPAFQAFRHVRDGFALAEMRDGVIEKYRRAAQAGDAHFESDARAQRRFFENQREEAAGQRAAVTVGMRLHIRGQMQKAADLRGTPFHAGEEVVGQRDRCGGSSGVHVYLAAARAIGCGFDFAFWVALVFVACFRSLFELGEKFRDVAAPDDEWRQQPQDMFVRAIDEQAAAQGLRDEWQLRRSRDQRPESSLRRALRG